MYCEQWPEYSYFADILQWYNTVMRNLTKTQWGLLFFNALYTVAFGVYYLRSFNYEFIAYTISIVVVIGLLYGTLKYTAFPTYIIFGITTWGLLHMMGGSVETTDGVLYAWKIFPFFC